MNINKRFSILAILMAVIMVLSIGYAKTANAAYIQRCHEIANSTGTQATELCFRITTTDAGSFVHIDNVRVWVKDPAGVKATDGLYINRVYINNPGGVTKWERDNIYVSKDLGSLEKNWQPDYSQQDDGWGWLSATVFWQDGSYDSWTTFAAPLN